jgi:hypothetical protein
MTAIHARLATHDDAAQRLLSAAGAPVLEQSILDSLRKLEESWAQLSVLANEREARLRTAHTIHKYMDAIKRAEMWAQDIATRMGAHAQGAHRITTVVQAQVKLKFLKFNKIQNIFFLQASISAHKDLQAEIVGRHAELTSLREQGHQIVADYPERKSEIQRAHKRLQTMEHEVNQAWERENVRLWQVYDRQVFAEQASGS